jgi:hypothetical protein
MGPGRYSRRRRRRCTWRTRSEPPRQYPLHRATDPADQPGGGTPRSRWPRPRGAGRRLPLSERSAARDCRPTIPSTSNPSARWNRSTAPSVLGPKRPSIGPGRCPRRRRWRCTSRTRSEPPGQYPLQRATGAADQRGGQSAAACGLADAVPPPAAKPRITPPTANRLILRRVLLPLPMLGSETRWQGRPRIAPLRPPPRPVRGKGRMLSRIQRLSHASSRCLCSARHAQISATKRVRKLRSQRLRAGSALGQMQSLRLPVEVGSVGGAGAVRALARNPRRWAPVHGPPPPGGFIRTDSANTHPGPHVSCIAAPARGGISQELSRLGISGQPLGVASSPGPAWGASYAVALRPGRRACLRVGNVSVPPAGSRSVSAPRR